MATIAPLGVYQALDDDGAPLAGGKLYTYAAGTLVPKTTYTSSTAGTPNTNPVILDSSGRGNVWLGDGGYKFVLKDSADNTIFTTDDIGGTNDTAFGANVNAISSNTIINNTYANSVNVCTSSPTLTLLTAASAGEGFYITVKNQGSGTVTIDPDGAELIDGAATLPIPAGMSAIIISNGTAWYSLFLATVTLGGNNAYTGNNSHSGTETFTGKILTPDDGELTIASGAITVTGVFHTVDTEADAASDDLVTINGGADGQELILRAENTARDVVLKTSGNISIPFDITLSDDTTAIHLKYDSTLSKWLQVGATGVYTSSASDLTSGSTGKIVTAAMFKSWLDTKYSLVNQATITTGVALNQSYTAPVGMTPTEFTVSVIAFSTNGTAIPIIQLSDAGGAETSGYVSIADNVSQSTGVSFGGNSASNTYTGFITFKLIDSVNNTWAWGGVMGLPSSPNTIKMAGAKSLSQPLNGFRLTTIGGTDQADGGTLGIEWCG